MMMPFSWPPYFITALSWEFIANSYSDSGCEIEDHPTPDIPFIGDAIETCCPQNGKCPEPFFLELI